MITATNSLAAVPAATTHPGAPPTSALPARPSATAGITVAGGGLFGRSTAGMAIGAIAGWAIMGPLGALGGALLGSWLGGALGR